ncbi:probable uridine nucleosidase 2 isoform X1 [Colias croceus]|uniref:probable uridine nucleosidase 2 isoform X1 n=1 Tax=Colias crocea TaxID=72248 RepID=UPI001E280839|nr:probable uridine nucleosidase 2 isoform X1 [Colias croceus]
METKYKNIIYVIPALLVATAVCVFLVLFLRSDGKDPRPKLVIDHDGGADDAIAIFMALLYEKAFKGPEVIALTTVHGNVNESQVFTNTQRILNIADRQNVPIYRGSKTSFISNIESDYFFGYDGLGDNEVEEYEPIEAQDEHAAMALVRLARKYEGRLTVVAIGALTNIALAIKLDPRFRSRLAQLYVGAGHIHDENYKEAEFNAAMDAEAYRIITNGSKPEDLSIVPFSPIRKSVTVETDWRLNVLGAIPSTVMQYLNKFERLSIPAQAPQWVLLDPAVMAAAINDSMADWKMSYNSIGLCENRGIATNNFTSEKPNARVLYSMDRDEYKQLLYNIFSHE